MRYESYGKAIGPPARRCRSVGKTLRICVFRALADGKMLAKCVPGRQSVASFALHASQKWLRTGKSPVRGSILPPCIQNELAMAGYARYASEKPRKPPFGNARREDLARKDPFSLHRPLESCTARRSCHPLTLDLLATRRLRRRMGCFVPSGSVVQIRAFLSSGEVARAVPAQCKATQHLPFLTDGAHSPSRFGGLRQGIRKGDPCGSPFSWSAGTSRSALTVRIGQF